MNLLADKDTETIRISIDTKATVNVGEYSRGGRSRGNKAVKALDHDMCPKVKLVPGGILEPITGRSFLFFGTSCKTSDFIVDGLILWWESRKHELCGLKQIVINVDNGPECSGHRNQFLSRLTEFADMTGMRLRIVYYPPYHSKYNSIERYWAGLEKSWNGYLFHYAFKMALIQGQLVKLLVADLFAAIFFNPNSACFTAASSSSKTRLAK